MLYCQPHYCFKRKILDGTFFGKKLHRVWCGTIFCSSCSQSLNSKLASKNWFVQMYLASLKPQLSLFNPILFLSKYVIIRDCIPDPWSERNKKIDTRMYAWMHFVLQVAHIIEKGVSQFKRTERYSDYVYECSYNMDVEVVFKETKSFKSV